MITTAENPFITAFVRKFGALDLRGYSLIGVQHLKAELVPLLDIIETFGLPFHRMHLLGKGYSTSSQVVGTLQDRGIQVQDTRADLEALTKNSYICSFRPTLENKLFSTLDSLRAAAATQKLIILDDGAIFHMIDKRKWLGVNVEQTRNGSYYVSQEYENMPRIQVGLAPAKRRHESQAIAYSCIVQTQKHLDAIGELSFWQRKPLVLGYGAIGRAITNELQRIGFLPQVYDTDAQKILEIQADNLPKVGRLDDAIAASNLIIGTTGNEPPPHLARLFSNIQPGTAFANAASMNYEFLGIGSPYGTKAADTQAFPAILLRVGTKNAFLLNGGFPINFTSRAHDNEIAPLDLTRALQLAGIYDGLRPQNRWRKRPTDRVLCDEYGSFLSRCFISQQKYL